MAERMAYEYTSYEHWYYISENELNRMGEEGWELCAVTTRQGEDYEIITTYFKRVKLKNE